MNKKKTALILAGCLLIAGTSFGVTYSYLKASDDKVNEFEIGRNEIEVTEEYKPPKKVEPGATFLKKPKVTNTGNIACYVRMRADFSDSEIEKLCDKKIGEHWTEKQLDGYYYYKIALEPDETTKSLFADSENGEAADNITIKTESDADKDKLDDFDIIIYAESCGVKEGESYWEAWGLTKEPTTGGENP